eukprot:m.169261 g.169261  ORF g.169261 m.169261 type:complete len:395 (-) comp21184_c0_seq1:45-1229(-)
MFAALSLVTRLFPEPQPTLAERLAHISVDPAVEERWLTALKATGCTGRKYLVIGAGFLGKKLLQALLHRGETDITVLDLLPVPACFASCAAVRWVQGSVHDSDLLQRTMRNVNVVYSTFALIRFQDAMPHELALSWTANVDGTHHVLAACREAGVQMLIQTSTSNVNITWPATLQHTFIFDEDTPYVTTPALATSHYGYTKAVAEQAVRAAHGSWSGFRAGCVRPCSAIYGSADRFHLQRALTKQHVLLYPVKATLDFVYVDNVVYAHLLMEKYLRTATELTAAPVVCVNDHQEPLPVPCLRELCPFIGTSKLSWYLCYTLARAVTARNWLRQFIPLPSLGELDELTLTSLRFCQLSYLLKSTRARDLLGYRPVFSVEEAVRRSVVEFREGKLL